MTQTNAEMATEDDLAAVDHLQESLQALRDRIGQTIVGMDDVLEQLVITLLCNGHCIFEGVPGLAKTLLVSSTSSLVGLDFKRIQFTPDLMPADITGSDILEEDHTTGRRVFRFVNGPIFAHMILADEINRTPPKTQSALLEAMQERHVTIGDKTHMLPSPFFVLATQNPIEQEGTYPLPEAQLDRFIMKIKVEYPSVEDEIEISMRATTEYGMDREMSPILSSQQIIDMQSLVRRVPTGVHVYEYAAHLVRFTRPGGGNGLKAQSGEDLLAWGSGPRGCIFLLLAAKARALLKGRFHATTEDVKAVALPVLRHRIVPTFHAQVADISPDDIVERIIEAVIAPEPR